jgi:hypothetical protein
MTQSAAASGSVGPMALDKTLGSYGLSDFSGSTPDVDPGFTSSRAHGLLLSLAFMVLFPSGAMVFSTGYGKGFRLHVILQLLASMSVLGGVALVAWPIVTDGGVSGRTTQEIRRFGDVLMPYSSTRP